MKVLSLWQPWADVIFRDDGNGLPLKPDETRHWSTNVRGTIAIHAAKKPLREVFREFPQMKFTLSMCGIREHELAFGALIGTVDIVQCVPTEDTHRFDWQQSWGDYTPGRFAFVLANPRRFSAPLPCVGRQGFFNTRTQGEE